MPDYQTGKIYKIMNDETDEIYIGSTCNSLAKRYGQHKGDYICYKNNKKNYITSFKLLDYPSSKIILIENFPCNNKEELNAREAYYIKLLPCVNKVIPLQTDKEYRNKNKDKHNLYTKKHYEENKEVYLERAVKRREEQDDEEVKRYKQDWYKKNKEDLSIKMKENYKQNSEDRKLKAKEYYEANKDAINQKKRDKRNKANN